MTCSVGYLTAVSGVTSTDYYSIPEPDWEFWYPEEREVEVGAKCWAVRGKSERNDILWGVFPHNRRLQAAKYASQIEDMLLTCEDEMVNRAYPDDVAVVRVAEEDLAHALAVLRTRVFIRDGYRCVKCAAEVAWDGPASGHMHERVHRGQQGWRTMHNAETLCAACHVGIRGEHGLAARKKKPPVQYVEVDEIPF